MQSGRIIDADDDPGFTVRHDRADAWHCGCHDRAQPQ